MIRLPPTSTRSDTRVPSATLFRSGAPPDAASMMHALRAAIHPCAIAAVAHGMVVAADNPVRAQARATWFGRRAACTMATGFVALHAQYGLDAYFFAAALAGLLLLHRKRPRLNSSH